MKSEKKISEEATLIGHLVRKEKQYLEKTLKNAETTHPNGNYRAYVVASLLLQDTQERSIAPKIAKKYPTLKEGLFLSVLYATRNLLEKIIQLGKQKLVVQSVDGCLEKKEVYNLTIEFAHLYYANGVIVSNTDAEDHDYDALRYRVTSLTRQPCLPPRIRQR